MVLEALGVAATLPLPMNTAEEILGVAADTAIATAAPLHELGVRRSIRHPR